MVVRQRMCRRSAGKMIEAGYLGVDFVGDPGVVPYLGERAEVIRGLRLRLLAN